MSISLHGIGIGGGIAIGRAHLISQSAADVAHYTLEAHELPAEKQRFETAIRATRKELEMLWAASRKTRRPSWGRFCRCTSCCSTTPPSRANR